MCVLERSLSWVRLACSRCTSSSRRCTSRSRTHTSASRLLHDKASKACTHTHTHTHTQMYTHTHTHTFTFTHLFPSLKSYGPAQVSVHKLQDEETYTRPLR